MNIMPNLVQLVLNVHTYLCLYQFQLDQQNLPYLISCFSFLLQQTNQLFITVNRGNEAAQKFKTPLSWM